MADEYGSCVVGIRNMWSKLTCIVDTSRRFDRPGERYIEKDDLQVSPRAHLTAAPGKKDRKKDMKCSKCRVVDKTGDY